MGSRKDQEREARRSYILDKAQALFAQKGYQGTSMAEIAEASEFAVGTLYTFFENKEEILATIFEVRVQDMVLETERIRSDPELDPLKRIELALDILTRVAMDNLDCYRIYIAESRLADWGSKTQVGGYVSEAVDAYQGCLVDIYRDAIAAGAIDAKFDPDFLAFFQRSLIRTVVWQTMHSPESVTLDEIIDQAKHMLFHGIKSGAKPSN